MAKIFGQLEKAQLENTTSDTAALPKGMATYRTDLNVAKVSDGATMKELVDTDTAQTLASKTLTAPTSNNGTFNTPTINNPTIADYADLEEQASVGVNPSAGHRRLFVKTDGNAYLRDSSGNETLLGSGGGGGINYIDNGKAEVNTTGWSTYADAAASSPVDGTGGAATLTFTRSTSSPLRDIASFLLTKDAANRQGEGVSYDFTIDAADKAKVLRITADYAVSSGTFSFGDGTVASPSDIRVFVYDVTNAVLIEPTQTLLDGSGRIVTEFQSASNSTSYRLIFHVATTSASAWVLQLDAVEVGPRDLARGPMITDWASFTPSDVSYAWGTVSSSSFKWRRVGDEAEIQAYFTLSSALSTNLSFDPAEYLPAGLSVDTSKLVTQMPFGNWFLDDASAASTADNASGACLINGSSGVLLFVTGDLADDILDATSLMTWASGDTFGFRISVPILGWSSNTVTSSDSGTRVVATRGNIATGQSFNSGSTDTIKYDTIIDDTGQISLNASTGVFTVNESGWYWIIGSLRWTNLADQTQSFMDLYANNVLIDRKYANVSGVNNEPNIFACAVAYLNAGETFYFQANQTSGAANTCGTGVNSGFSAFKVQSPQSIGMADKTHARYTTNAGQSIPNATATIINFEDKNFDYKNNVTVGSSWKFTADQAGEYRFSVGMLYAGATGWDAGDQAAIYLYKNNIFERVVAFNELISSDSTASSRSVNPGVGSDSIYLLAEDYIDFRAFHTRGGSTNLAALADYNYVDIKGPGI